MLSEDLLISCRYVSAYPCQLKQSLLTDADKSKIESELIFQLFLILVAKVRLVVFRIQVLTLQFYTPLVKLIVLLMNL